ncbi:MAG: pyrroline-5-carboxylate reductase [Burkholderiaceae bacterium]|nr:pyrroline-5-carboxylate reductase [Microbacteriaceae bacterium]
MINLPSIAILGTGSMGGAILSGLLSPQVTVDGGIRVTNRTEAKAAALRTGTVTSLSSELDPDANLAAVAGASIVLVAVKPAMVPGVLHQIADVVDPGAIVVCVAAGVTIATMEAIVSVPVLRAMPNTPSTVGRGVTGLSAGPRATPEQVDAASALFGTVGEVLVVPEEQIDALSTISGSGPAYVFSLIESLTRTAMNHGFTLGQSRVLVESTFLGASELLAASGETPTELRRRVTSPGGTTAQAIAVIEEADLTAVFDRATGAALARAVELSAG